MPNMIKLDEEELDNLGYYIANHKGGCGITTCRKCEKIFELRHGFCACGLDIDLYLVAVDLLEFNGCELSINEFNGHKCFRYLSS